MSLKSAAGEEFLKKVEDWLRSQGEVLILIRYSRAAGDKDFEFCKSFAALQERLHQLPAEACVTVFRNPQLQLRGIVDDEFIGKMSGKREKIAEEKSRLTIRYVRHISTGPAARTAAEC